MDVQGIQNDTDTVCSLLMFTGSCRSKLAKINAYEARHLQDELG